MKSVIIKIIYFAAFAVTIINMGFLIFDAYRADISDLPKGEFLYSTVSPDKLTQLRVYKVDCSLGTAIRVECVNSRKKVERNIYWNVGDKDAKVVWHGPQQASINGVHLNVIDGEVYDCRRGTSIFLEGSVLEDES